MGQPGNQRPTLTSFLRFSPLQPDLSDLLNIPLSFPWLHRSNCRDQAKIERGRCDLFSVGHNWPEVSEGKFVCPLLDL